MTKPKGRLITVEAVCPSCLSRKTLTVREGAKLGACPHCNYPLVVWQG